MKLTVIVLLAACMQVSANSFSQTITINVKNAPLSKVFKEIQNQTGYGFIYTEMQLQKTRNVNLQVTGEKIEHVLDMIFKDQPFTYVILNKIIILKQRSEEPPSVSHDLLTIDVTGKVINEKGEPVSGVTVTIKGTNTATSTDNDGAFYLSSVDRDAILVFTSVNVETFELKVSGKTELLVRLKTKVSELGDVIVTVNTGYQQIPKERSTGSFVQVDEKLFNRTVSTNVLERLDGIVAGLHVFGSQSSIQSQLTGNVGASKLGLSIRGQSTLQTAFVSSDPLIIVDNFIYNGSINNINPNDVESVTVLKDAAAASIWGIRSGNGVIVVTTKKGKFNQRMKVDFNANVTVGEKPELFYNGSLLNASDYIDVDLFLYSKGLYNFALSSPARFPFSPVIEIAQMRKAGLISAADSANRIDAFRNMDIRDQYNDYVYQNTVNQQYSLGISGGSDKINYLLSLGFDDNRQSLKSNSSNRVTINSVSTFTPVKNLEIRTGIQYSQTKSNQPNQVGLNSYSIGGFYGPVYPYARFVDDEGNPAAIVRGYRLSWVDTIQNLGYEDWHYRPLQEIGLGDNTIKVNDLTLQAQIKYNFTNFLSAQVSFQNEKQTINGRNYQSPESFAARNLINMYSVRQPGGTFIYNFPVGGILNLRSNDLSSNQFRGQVDFNRSFAGKHLVNVIAGGEVREIKTTISGNNLYGYNDETGTAVSNLNYNTVYPIYPTNGSSRLPEPGINITGINERTLSYYANAAYTYDNRYTISLSGRRDGANIFGVKTNDKITPFWSAGVKWNIDKESFYGSTMFPSLVLRATYGYNGNIYNGGAYLTGQYSNDGLTGVPVVNILTPPNPELRWEKIKNINIGIDFSLKKNIIYGSLEWYQKDGLDLIENAPLAPSTGFLTFRGNAASTRTRGIDVTLNSRNIDAGFKWYTTLLLTTVKDKVVHYDEKYIGTSLVSQTGGIAIEGKPLFSVFSYQWAGLDPMTGDPQGYLNKQVSKNYAGIINNTSPDSLVFHGSARPTLFGALRNTFNYRNFSFSFNISYEFGYYFRRSSTNLNYRGVLLAPHADYANRWKAPGDEMLTNIPSLVYPNDDNRNLFYQFSEVLVEKGDNIKLRDIQLSYDIDKRLFPKMPFESLRIYMYAANLGLIWTANDKGIDPAFYNSVIRPGKTISFGVRTSF